MAVHIFGAKSSPSVANFALLQTAQDNPHHFNDDVLETVRTKFYVDYCLKSVNSVEEARKLVHDLIELLKLGGFQLKKWLSNEPSVLSQVDISDRAHTDLNLDLNSKTTENVLGFKWDFITDTLQMISTSNPNLIREEACCRLLVRSSIPLVWSLRLF